MNNISSTFVAFFTQTTVDQYAFVDVRLATLLPCCGAVKGICKVFHSTAPHKIKMPHVGHIAKRCVWLIGIGVNIIAVSTDISAIANAIAESGDLKQKK